MNNLKPSGIEWIGSIPVDWKTVPIYYVAKEVTTKNKTLLRKNAFKFFFGNIINKPNFNPDEDNYVNKTIRNYIIVNPGDIVINGLNLNFDFVTKRVGMVTRPGTITSAYISLRPKANVILPKYMLYILRTYDSEKAFHNMGGGVRKILNYDELSKSKIILPSISAQTRIIKFLDKKVSQIDDISKKIQQEITDLEKYRKSIITKAVTKGLNPNVPMKNSNISWIGEVPSNWHIEKLKFIAETRNNKELLSNVQNNYIGLENIVKNTGQYVCSNTTYEEGYYDVCKKGDILYGKLRPNLSKVLVAPFDSCCSGEFLIFKSAKINLKYLFYYLLSQGITEIATSAIYGTKMPRVSWDFIKNLFISFPPKNEDQKEIVNYLDIQCNKIDSILKNKHILLKKLNQYKQSIIYEYVTGKKQVPTEKGAKK
jgi:type I restriction enzyme S subunit